ncbi:hypothetical protein SAMN04515695_5194 [Pseudovibrio sp. Tun.PSC04-5.I4]|nr:hypothetical protein SAMN04515695_5194 [Pseudovibrio sp. Tun.PSC04-5.I4]
MFFARLCWCRGGAGSGSSWRSRLFQRPTLCYRRSNCVGWPFARRERLSCCCKQNPEGGRGVIAFAPGAGRIPQTQFSEKIWWKQPLRKLARRMFKAYMPDGATGPELGILPPAGNEGHSLFLRNYRPDIWVPIAEPFLERVLQYPNCASP